MAADLRLAGLGPKRAGPGRPHPKDKPRPAVEPSAQPLAKTLLDYPAELEALRAKIEEVRAEYQKTRLQLFSTQKTMEALITEVTGTLAALSVQEATKYLFLIQDQEGIEKEVYGWEALGHAVHLKASTCRTRISMGNGTFKITRGQSIIVVRRLT